MNNKFLYAFVFIIGSFFFVPEVTAAIIWEAPNNLNSTTGDGSQTFNTLIGSTWPYGYSFGKTSGYISYIDVSIGATTLGFDSHPTQGVTLIMSRGTCDLSSGSTTSSLNSLTLGDLVRDGVSFQRFYFNSSQIDFSTECLKALYIDLGVNWSWMKLGVSSVYGIPDLGNEYKFNSPIGTNATTTQSWSMNIYDESGEPVGTGSSIEFTPQNFYDGMTTPDFSNWWLTASTTQAGFYNWDVTWGTSTPDVYTNDFATDWGAFMLDAESSRLLSVIKVPTSTPGNYVAIAHLYSRNSATSTDELIATSALLHFTVSSGDIISLPPDNPSFASFECSPTSFELVGVDFGRGLCEVGRFLLVPSQGALNQWLTFQSNLAQRIPFSYVVQSINFIQTYDPSATSSIPTINISTGTTTPISISVTIFSTSTLTQFFSPSRLSQFRTLMEVGLYISFITAMLLTLKNLFR